METKTYIFSWTNVSEEEKKGKIKLKVFDLQ